MKSQPITLLTALVLTVFSCFLFSGCNEANTSSDPTDSDSLSTNPEVPNVPETSADTTTMVLEGIDVSHYQGTIDWSKVAASGKKFAFCKATGGITFDDPEFATNWAGIKEAGLVRGAYHFFDPEDDAQSQADHFISVVTLEAGDFAPVLDIEVEEGQDASEIDSEITVWLTAIEAHYGIKPIIYSDYSFLESDLASGFCDYPLWLADYADHEPATVSCWDNWDLWQYSSSGSVDGIEGDVDLDQFKGTEADYQALRKQ